MLVKQICVDNAGLAHFLAVAESLIYPVRFQMMKPFGLLRLVGN